MPTFGDETLLQRYEREQRAEEKMTSSNRHTEEPWQIPAGQNSILDVAFVCQDGVLIGSADLGEDARRIVACVNACAGIPTEELESGEARKVRDELADIDRLEQQRDELLAALRKALHHIPVEDAEAMSAARDAIAKAEGR